MGMDPYAHVSASPFFEGIRKVVSHVWKRGNLLVLFIEFLTCATMH